MKYRKYACSTKLLKRLVCTVATVAAALPAAVHPGPASVVVVVVVVVIVVIVIALKQN
jgi:hypothetical protein